MRILRTAVCGCIALTVSAGAIAHLPFCLWVANGAINGSALGAAALASVRACCEEDAAYWAAVSP